ncbi:MAG: tetratricopeptide repeat protein [Magnetospirillum sp.]|nr:tetratricopeptide repeat protein [Magnetospirillum sp.]
MARTERIDEALAKAQRGELAKARTLARELGKVPAAHPGLMILAAMIHQQGEPALALKFLDRAVLGNSADAHYGRGVTLAALGRNDEAGAALRRRLDIMPEHVAALTNLGGMLQMAGDLAEAEQCYGRALAADANASLALHNMAGLCLSQGRRGEAEDFARRAHAVAPCSETALRLADILGEGGSYSEAEAILRAALAIMADDPRLWRSLGFALKKLQRGVEAIAAYRAALELNPDDGEARHMIAALTGAQTQQAPADYVRGFFDTYADRFESHLLEKVQYEAPTHLRNLFDRVAGEQTRLDAVLDLGCGTGLTAEAFQGRVDRFLGVDLSPRMLEIASGRGLYADLREADAALALARSRSLSAVMATDLFIYIGDLDDVFAGAAAALAPGGWFLFSVESADGEDYKLLPTGRYAQSPAYIRSLLARHGLTEIACEHGRIRGGADGDIDGDYWIARKPE